MKQILLIVFLGVLTLSGFGQSVGRFEIALPTFAKTATLDGRLLLFLSTKEGAEPRFQISDEVDSQQMFGMDVEGVRPGQSVTFDIKSSGYPKESFVEIPAGEYYVQVLLHKYETFKRSDGKTIKLPMDRGEGQNWRSAPGNSYSKPIKIRFDPKSSKIMNLKLDQVNPELGDPAKKQTEYIKYIKIKSEKLSIFWGIGQGWVRFTYGGSTGGWEALAAQIFYPDEFNGCFAACPDPITFEAYTMVNLYDGESI